MKLFAVLLGGRAEGCNTELHDVVFAIGNSLEETYPQLIQKWFGSKKRLHIDSYIEMAVIDGHEIELQSNPSSVKKQLYFVNYGGYKKGYFGEIHEVNFYVAESKEDVLARAKQELGKTLYQPHCDDHAVIDDVFAIETVGEFYIHLTPTTRMAPLQIENAYIKL